MPVVDTNLLIHAAQGREPALAALDRLRGESLALLLPSVAAIEYLAGAADRVTASRWLRGGFRIVHTDDLIVDRAAELYASAHVKGARPGWNDTVIAAVASLRDTYVVTANKRDFRRLGVDAWDFMTEADPPQ